MTTNTVQNISGATLPTVLPIAQQAPAPAPEMTAEDKQRLVAVTLNKLSKTAVQNLWEEKVTKATGLKKIFGLISYAWNKKTAAAADKPVLETIQEFNKAAVELVHAIATRSLTPPEANKLGLPKITFVTGSDQNIYAQGQLAAKNKLEHFYAVFKKRVQQLNINENSPEFGVYAAAAQKAVDDLSTAKEFVKNLYYPDILKVTMAQTLQKFNSHIFSDMIEAYANQPIGDITPDSFQKKSASIGEFFPTITLVDIETQMRKAILSKHNQGDLEAITDEFLSTDPQAPRFVAARDAMKAGLEVELASFQAKLHELRGPNGFNGVINTAVDEMANAEAEMNLARNAYINQRQGYGNAARLDTPDDTLINLPVMDPAIVQAQQDFAQKVQLFKAKKEACAILDKELKEIARYEQGSDRLIGGKLYEIKCKLESGIFEQAARAEIAKNGDFYNELGNAITKTNKQERSRALHQIINN